MNKKQKSISLKRQFYYKNYFNYVSAIIMMLLAAIFQIMIAFVLQKLLDIANKGKMEEFKNVFFLTIIVLGGFSIFQGIHNLFLNRYLKKAVTQYKGEIFSNIQKKNINSFSKESTSTYISAFSNDMLSIEQNYLMGFFKIILQVVLFIGGLLSMAYLNWKMFLITLVASLIPIVVSSVFGNKLISAEKHVSSYNAGFTALVNDLLSGFTVIKSFRASNEINQIFDEKNDLLERTKKKRRDLNSIIEVFNESASNIVEIAVFASGVYLAIKGEITVGVVIAFIQLLNYVLGPIGLIGGLIANRKAAEALIMKMERIVYSEEQQDNGKRLETFKYAIEYKNVTFGYESGMKNIEDINLKFEKNKSYAIVGGSGSGKSTLLNMMLGYHDDYEGSILIDGEEMRNFSKDSIFDLISVIQQNVFVFDTSIEENITLFKTFEPEKIHYAEKFAGLTQIIKEKGTTYKCGENGVNLSGGEKQRISIARCLIRDAAVLLMDEATAALDNETSYMVENAILNIENLTKIIITHKMDENMLRKYDEIIVMNKGKVCERGAFKELIDKKGYFYSLYTVTELTGK